MDRSQGIEQGSVIYMVGSGKAPPVPPHGVVLSDEAISFLSVRSGCEPLRDDTRALMPFVVHVELFASVPAALPAAGLRTTAVGPGPAAASVRSAQA